jgi:hypothetical protein
VPVLVHFTYRCCYFKDTDSWYCLLCDSHIPLRVSPIYVEEAVSSSSW